LPPPPSSPGYLDLLARLDRSRLAGVTLGLDRTRAVLAKLGDPQRRAITVQIAGTNGKGSTAAITEAILRAAGIRTGLYTSPHLCRFTERIRIDGREADGNRLAALDEAISATGVPLTYFEIATVLAFMTYAETGVEVAVLETGLGGRLDATTTCDPVATAITSIALDHSELLGSTLTDIAREKAGIAKPGVPLFLAPVPPEADVEIATVTNRANATLLRFGVDFAPPPFPPVLSGSHQIRNAGIAVALARAAAGAAGHVLTSAAIESGLRDVAWPGRLERIGDQVLLDCAHNMEGAVALAAALDALPRQSRALVFSIVAGKPAAAMLAALGPRFDAIVLTRSSNQRSLSPDMLARMAPPELASKTSVAADPLAALERARSVIGAAGLLVAAGSTFLVGDLRAALLGESRDPIPTSDPV
jgi:dihydrofolate synthase/folylpolyglutamate synthase